MPRGYAEPEQKERGQRVSNSKEIPVSPEEEAAWIEKEALMESKWEEISAMKFSELLVRAEEALIHERTELVIDS